MPPDSIALNKAAIIERCIRRMQEEYTADPSLSDITHLDALTLNIERACQAAIDLALHVVAERHLGMPQSSSDAFGLLRVSGVLAPDLSKRLAGMAGFRNIAVHQDQDLDQNIIHFIVKEGWKDFLALCTTLDLHIAP